MYGFLNPLPTGIKFGDYLFSEPSILPSSAGLADILSSQSGLYAILVQDSGCSPRPFRVIYFGESDNVNTRATESHENYTAWKREAGSYNTIYRAFCYFPNSNKVQRQAAESALIVRYNPPCNQRLSFDFSRLFLETTR